jgi:hypothetical protein
LQYRWPRRWVEFQWWRSLKCPEFYAFKLRIFKLKIFKVDIEKTFYSVSVK